MQIGSFLYSASDSKLRKKYIQAKAKNFYHSRQHFFAQKKTKNMRSIYMAEYTRIRHGTT